MGEYGLLYAIWERIQLGELHIFDFENNVLENGGIGWMEHVYNFGTGINEVDKESNVFQVVPDGNKIWIYEKETTSLTDRISVEIFALDGKRIWKEEMELVGGKGALGMEKGNYPRGVYYFRVTRKGEMPNNLLVLF